jgi:membrane-bound serine protease (ClpP class)
MATNSPARSRARLLLAVLALAMAAALLSGGARPAFAQDGDTDGPVVDVLPVRGFLDPPVASAMTGLIADAEERGAELVVLQVDGPGAISADADALLAAVRDARVPVAVFASPQQGVSAEAGGLYGMLWATAPLRAMSEVATVGPVAPTDLASGAMPDEASEARLAEIGAVDAFSEARTAEQLEVSGAVDVVASNVAGMLAELDGAEVTLADGTTTTLSLGTEDVNVRLHSMGILARLLHAAAAPAFIYLLLVLGLGTLAFELFQPGFGVAGFAGLVMLPFAVFGLFVLPVTWWALALLLLGLVLYALDAAVAGLGPVTAAATAAFGTGSWFLFGSGVLRVPPALAIVMTLTVLVFFVVVLTMILRAQAGPEGVDVADLVDRHGIVRSVLNPEGHVYVDEALWRARTADGSRMRVGTPVVVTGVDGAVLVVEPFEATPAGSGAGASSDEA